jgi:hypothetical protein
VTVIHSSSIHFVSPSYLTFAKSIKTAMPADAGVNHGVQRSTLWLDIVAPTA